MRTVVLLKSALALAGAAGVLVALATLTSPLTAVPDPADGSLSVVLGPGGEVRRILVDGAEPRGPDERIRALRDAGEELRTLLASPRPDGGPSRRRAPLTATPGAGSGSS